MGRVIKKMREFSDEELIEQLALSKRELLDQRFESVTGHIASVKKVSNIKKKIARILTLANERRVEKQKKRNEK